MNKQRIHWIDWSKCLLIYLVVLGHYGHIPTLVDNFISAFHMPAFFLISGYLHRSTPLKTSLIKSFKRLIIPALLFSILCWLLTSCVMQLRHIPFTMDEYVYKPLLGIIRYDRPNVAPPCGVIWFLQILFIGKILLDVVVQKGKEWVLWSVCLVCIAMTAIWYAMGIDDRCYIFFLQRTCACFPFIALGYMCKERQWLQRLFAIKFLPYILLGIYVAGVIYNGCVGLFSWSFGHNVFLYYSIALIGCIDFFLIVNRFKIGGGNLLITISNGTIVILCLHRLMISLFRDHLHIDAFMGSLIICAACYPFILFFNRYMPWFVGKSK